MTPLQQLRVRGVRLNLANRGINVITDTFGDDGNPETLTVMVQDETMLNDPTGEAKQKTPVYATVSAMAKSIKNPRAVGTFQEVNGTSEWKVIEYKEKSADAVTWNWLCEAKRG